MNVVYGTEINEDVGSDSTPEEIMLVLGETYPELKTNGEYVLNGDTMTVKVKSGSKA